MKKSKVKVHDLVGKIKAKVQPDALYILERSTMSAFPIAVSYGKGWVVPKDLAAGLSKNMVALLTKPSVPQMSILSTAERDFHLRSQGYKITTPNQWAYWPTFKALVKWVALLLYWNAIKYTRLAMLKFCYRAEKSCAEATEAKKKIAKNKRAKRK